MARYIELDAVLAEIEKIIADETESIKSFEHHKNTSELQRSNARIGVLTHLRSLLDTLEMKEANSKKELSYEDYTRFFAEHPNFPNDWGFDEAWVFAKYFFELGLKAQKGELV